MDPRLKLHNLLETTFTDATGISPNGRVYYQPPESVRLSYPCILYKLSDMPSRSANNRPYIVNHTYELTVIDRDPLSALREKIAQLPRCILIRSFEADNLHHYVFRIYT